MIKKDRLYGPEIYLDWTLIDDVATTGGSLRRAIEIVRSQPREIVVAFDRREVNENPGVYSIFER